MSKIAAVFSGQGSQYAGMGKKLWEDFAYVRGIYECGGDILGYDLAKVCFEGEDELKDTLYAQPAIFASSVAGFEAARRELGFAPFCAAGHSLGEYPALCCAGAFGVEDGFRIIKARAGAMSQSAGRGEEQAMFAIIGAEDAAIIAACESSGGYVIPANYNAPGQTVISGLLKYAEKAAETLSSAGAKAIRLSVSAAFHTELMQDAARRFADEVKGISCGPASIAFYSNVTGEKLGIDDYPEYFYKHSVSPVLFTKQVSAMVGDGVEICVDFGPKKTAAALAKKNDRRLKIMGVEETKSLDELKALI